MTLHQLLIQARHILLDFDGPTCAVFAGAVSASAAAQRLAVTLRDHGVDLTPDAEQTADPFRHLYTAARHGREHAAFAEAALRDLEVEAVATAPISPGALDTLTALAASGRTATIVSNNSVAAVTAFADRYALHRYLNGIVARTDPDPALLKPNPHLVRRAMTVLGAEPSQCLLIGDSVTDITAAHAAGIRVIAFANKPGKHHAFAPHHPDAVIADMRVIAKTLAALPRHNGGDAQ